MIFGGFTSCTLIDYPGKTAAMVYTIGCNFRCPYCHNLELVNETVDVELPESYILSFLETRRDLLDGLVITGGEPTIHGDDLLRFIKKIKDLGFLVKLDTNGTNPDFLKQVVKEKLVDYVAMDVKAPLRKYNNIACCPVDIDAIRESIDFLKKDLIPYEFRTTVIKSLLSPDDLKKIIQDIKGAKRYFLQKFVPSKVLNPQFKRKVSYSDDDFLEFQRFAEKSVRFCGIR